MYPHLNIGSLPLPFNSAFVVPFSFIAHSTDTTHSSTLGYLSANQTPYRGTLSNAFSKSTKAIHSTGYSLPGISLAAETSYKISICRAPPCHINPNFMLSIFKIFLTFTLSKTFIACSLNSFMPLYEPHVSASRFPLKTFIIHLLLRSSGILQVYHPSPQNYYIHWSSTSFCSLERLRHNPCWICQLALLHLANCRTASTSNVEILSLGPHTGLAFVNFFYPK